MKRYRIGLVLLLVVATTATADVQLVLQDGRVLDGREVTREEGQYLLELAGNEVMSIPVELVAEVRLATAKKKPKPATGFRKAEPKTIGGSDPVEEAPSGIRDDAAPEVLAGIEVRPTRPNEATAALGEPAKFQPGLSDPYWRPDPVFNEENDVTNFAPSTWSQGVGDPTWTPDSAYEASSNALTDSESSWQGSVVDNRWAPTDGFKKTGTSFRPGTPVASRGPAGEGERSRLDVTPVDLVTGGGAPTADQCAWCPDLQPAVIEASSTATTAATAVATKSIPAATGDGDSREARRCARSIFRPTVEAAGGDDIWHLRTSRWDDPAAERIPIEIHVSALTLEERTYSATFAIVDGECRPIRETSTLVNPGVAAGEDRPSPSEAYNAAIVGSRPALSSDPARIEYAVSAVALLADSEDEGRPATREVIDRSERLDEILAETGSACSEPGKKQRKQQERAAVEFSEPSITAGYGGSRVTLVTWSPDTGRLESHGIEVANDGRVAIRTRELVACVGR